MVDEVLFSLSLDVQYSIIHSRHGQDTDGPIAATSTSTDLTTTNLIYEYLYSDSNLPLS